MKTMKVWGIVTGSASITSLMLTILSIIGFIPTISVPTLNVTGEVVPLSINSLFILIPVFVVSTAMAFYFLNKLG